MFVFVWACSGGLSASRVIRGLPGLGCTNDSRYLQADPMTGAVVELCGRRRPAALPVAPCDDARIGGLVYDAKRSGLFYSTLTSVRFLGQSDDLVAGAYGVLRISGAHLADAKVTVRGTSCFVRESTQGSVLCGSTSPAVVGPTALPLEASDVSVTTIGGSGSFSTPDIAMLRAAEYTIPPPAVFQVEILESFALRAAALVLAEDTLFVSSIGANAGYPGILTLDVVTGNLTVFLEGARRVQGLAFDSWLYYSDADASVVVRRPPVPGRPRDEFDEVLARLPEPRGLALDPTPGYVLRPREGQVDVYVSTAQSIVRLNVVGSEVTQDLVVVGSAPDGLFLYPGAVNRTMDRELRLLWVDANEREVQRATRYGTRQTSLDSSLRFPRTLTRHHEDVYVGEWLGRIWRLPQQLLREESPNAQAIRHRLDEERFLRTYHNP